MIVHGPGLHTGQQRAVELITGPAKHVTVVAPRQTGKTFFSIQCLLYWAINFPGSTTFFISPTYQQAKKPMEELYNAIQNSGIVKSNNQSDFRIILKNGSSIVFKSSERPDNLRGYTGDFMVVDEAAYQKDEVWNAVLKPIMLVKGKKVLFISTPRGNNWFKRMFDLGQSPDNPKYASCRMHYAENPYLDLDELEDARRTLPSHIFAAEYEGTFTDSGNTVFSLDTATSFTKWPAPVGKVYCGIDLGRANDYTVATFIDSTGNIVDIYRDNQREWASMVSQIVSRLKKYKATAFVEVNSIGDVVHELIKKQHFDTHPFVTSNKSKNDAIERLAVDLNNSDVKIPSETLFAPLWQELSLFEYEYSVKNKTLRYSAPPGLHDDTVMSLAIANACKNEKKTSGQYSIGSVRL